MLDSIRLLFTLETTDGLVERHRACGPGNIPVQPEEGKTPQGVRLVEIKSPDRCEADPARPQLLFVEQTVIP